MDTMKVSVLIEALALVGQIYRSKDGSKEADAVTKVIQQLHGEADMTLAEWVQKKKKGSNAKTRISNPKKKFDEAKIDAARANLSKVTTQAGLRSSISSLKLNADEWKMLAKSLTAESPRTGKAAAEIVEAHYSDNLLLDDRIDSVKRLFG